MKIPIRKSTLLSALQKVIHIVPARSTLQVLSSIYVKIDGKHLTVRATDLDLSITTSTEIKPVKASKAFIINAKKLFDIVKELPETDIEFNISAGDHIIISTGADEFKLPIQTPEEFPENPTFKEVAKFNLKGGVLDEMSTRVRFAVARDTTRVSLKGVLCELEGNTIRMVATDGHKLSMCREDNLAQKVKEKISIIIPPKALEQLSKIMADENDEVTVQVGKIYAQFSANATVLTTKLIEGDYPKYEEAIPKNNEKKAVIKRDELSTVLKRISVMSNSRTRQVRFAFDKDSLVVSTSDRDFRGEGKSKLPIKYDAESLVIGFNADFFIEILRLMEGDDVVVSMNNPLSATLILPMDKKQSDKMLFLIMPLRLLDEELNE
jgi:DNA polymerase-3 subunit beta